MEDSASPRVRRANSASIRSDGEYVLYWMIAARRPSWNFALDRAVAWCRELDRPLLVFEPIRCGYRWASDRLHRFVFDGMAHNARAFAATPARYYPYVEPAPGAGSGLLEALASRAAVVVTDEFPCFFLPRMVSAAADRLAVRLEVVDSNGLLPLSAGDRAFETAYAFRRHLQRTLAPFLGELPRERPFAGKSLRKAVPLPREIESRWPAAGPELLDPAAGGLARLPIDHSVPPAPTRGGAAAARSALASFLDERFDGYADRRNDAAVDATSGLSPFLHFGHLSIHEIFARIARREEWSPLRLAAKATGSREGWWGMSRSAEAFLDESVTWRELGYQFCARRLDYDRYESLPSWARATLDRHAGDPRAFVYSMEEFSRAETHDPLWNAAQRQLVREGRIHNYLRMLWGKKILEWSPSPRSALETLIELNNRYALDGRNPNSYTGICWTLGRFDRPWAPERAVFGTIRYMSSENTARKYRVQGYLRRYAADAVGSEEPRLFN